MLLAALAGSPATAALPGDFGLSLKWDANPESNIAGYRLHVGTAPGHYVDTIDVGGITEFYLSGLDEDLRHHIAVTAYNDLGIESGFSEDLAIFSVAFSLESPLAIDRLLRGPGGTVSFELAESPWQPLDIDVYVSEDLVVWTLLETVEGAGEAFTIVDPRAVEQPQRFYQLENVSSGDSLPTRRLSVTRFSRGVGGTVSFELAGGDGLLLDIGVYASEDLENWTLIEMVEGVGEEFSIVDSLSAVRPRRFYRLEYPD